MKRLIEFLILAPAAALAIPVLVDSALKGAVLLTAILLGMLLLKRASAALRHFVLIASMLAMLALPILSVTLPDWRVLPAWANIAIAEDAPVAPTIANSEAMADIVATTTSIAIGTVADLVPVPASETNWIPIASWIWLIGGSVLGLWLLAGQLALWRTGRNACQSSDPKLHALADELRARLGIRRRIELLTHPDRPMPMTWGFFKTRLLLPAESSNWQPERVRAVLLHELAHVKRRDCLTQLLVRLTCAIHWFNPLVWVAARKIATERERACDDLVLNSGVRASDYAEHLLHIATGCDAQPLAASNALAMAKRSRLEGRLTTILSRKTDRRGITPRTALAVGAVLTLCAMPVAMMQAVAQDDTPSTFEEIGPEPALEIPRAWIGDSVIGKILSVKPEHGVVVVDSGKRSGRRIGDELRILRGSKPIGTLKIVDVRDSLSGCLVTGWFGEGSADFRVEDQVARPAAVALEVGEWYDRLDQPEIPFAYHWDPDDWHETFSVPPAFRLGAAPKDAAPFDALGHELSLSDSDFTLDSINGIRSSEDGTYSVQLGSSTPFSIIGSENTPFPSQAYQNTPEDLRRARMNDARIRKLNGMLVLPSPRTGPTLAERAEAIIAMHPKHPVISGLAAELHAHELEREKFLQKYAAKHPRVIAAEATIERLERLIVRLDAQPLEKTVVADEPLVGIGALLLSHPKGVLVREVLKGGAAHRAGELDTSDLITAVGEGPDGEWHNIEGLEIADIVGRIRGEAGTTVRLKISRKVDGQPRSLEFTIKRGPIHVGKPISGYEAAPYTETTVIDGDVETTIRVDPPEPQKTLVAYNLKFADAAGAEKAINAIIGRKATVVASERTNQLLVNATPEAHELIEKMVKELDAPSE